MYELTLGVAALALAADLRIAHWSRAAITGLVVDLGRRPGDSMVDEQLARAVGDSSLVVGYVVEEGRPPVDQRGRPIALPEPGAGRAVTPVAFDGRTLAVLVHDSASLGDPRSLAGAASVLSVALERAGAPLLRTVAEALAWAGPGGVPGTASTLPGPRGSQGCRGWYPAGRRRRRLSGCLRSPRRPGDGGTSRGAVGGIPAVARGWERAIAARALACCIRGKGSFPV